MSPFFDSMRLNTQFAQDRAPAHHLNWISRHNSCRKAAVMPQFITGAAVVPTVDTRHLNPANYYISGAWMQERVCRRPFALVMTSGDDFIDDAGDRLDHHQHSCGMPKDTHHFNTGHASSRLCQYSQLLFQSHLNWLFSDEQYKFLAC